MDFAPRTPDDQKCARKSCGHPFAAHNIEKHCGCQLKCAACGCFDFAYPEDFDLDAPFSESTDEHAVKKRQLKQQE